MQRTSRHESVQNKVNMWVFGCLSSPLYSVFWMSSFLLQIYLHYQCMEAIVYSKRSLVLCWVSWSLIRSLFCWLIDKISAFFSILKFLWGSFSVTICGRIILKRTVVSDWRFHWEWKSSSESSEICLSVSGVTASLGRWNWLMVLPVRLLQNVSTGNVEDKTLRTFENTSRNVQNAHNNFFSAISIEG